MEQRPNEDYVHFQGYNPSLYPFYPSYLPQTDPSFQDLEQKYKNLMVEHELLKERCSELEKIIDRKKVTKRRQDTQLDRCHPCPFPTCSREYASNFALNLHLKNKHNCGNKKERDRTARRLIKYEQTGEKAPKQKIKLPPGYLEQNRVRLMLMESSQESKNVKTEE